MWLDSGSILLQLAAAAFNNGFTLQHLLSFVFCLSFPVFIVNHMQKCTELFYHLSDNVDVAGSYRIS